MTDSLFSFGDSIKTLERAGDTATVGAHGILWGDSKSVDLVGDWFTARTVLGARKGIGVDTMLHHGIPLADGLKAYAGLLLPPTVKAEPDDHGLLVATVLNLKDSYQRKIFELCESGALSWSSGANPRGVKRAEGKIEGEITQWPIIEFSFTPTPCEPRISGIHSMKSFDGLFDGSDGYAKAVAVLGLPEVETVPVAAVTPAEVKTEIPNDEPPVGLSFADHSMKALAAVAEFVMRADSLVEMRCVKAGRVLSHANCDMLGAHRDALQGHAEALQGHADNLTALLDEHGKSAPADIGAVAKALDAEIMAMEMAFIDQGRQMELTT